jgi:hypothetical protein
MSRLIVLIAGMAAASAASPAARAEYQDPFHCKPPIGQSMFEMGARNMAMRYRQEPTPANKATMCNSYRKAVDAYAKSNQYCRRNTCETESFRETCARHGEKLREWQERQRAECGARR